MLTDAADGIIARRFDLVTALGKLLDPLADKLSLLTLIALFVWSGQIPAWVMAVVLIKEFVLVVGSMAALRLGVVVCALPVGKLTTAAFVVSTVTRFLGWKAAADMLLSVSLGLSMTALAWYMTAGFKKRKDEKHKDEKKITRTASGRIDYSNPCFLFHRKRTGG
jgi:phosphatidylglycerophosphate synthase